MKTSLATVLLAFGVWQATAQEASDRFYQVIRNNDIQALRGLARTADLNVEDKRGATPLMYASAFGSMDAMKLLLDAGADVNAKNAFGATALLWCANDINKVRLLVAKGADVDARSRQGRTALLVAASHHGASAIVRFLLSKGADISLRDGFQTTPLLAATDANDTAAIGLLLEKGQDVNAKNLAGFTPLMNAAGNGNAAAIKALLAKGADVNAVSAPPGGLILKNGPVMLGSFTPLILAAAYGGPAAAKLLLDAGANVNAQDARGMTPLMLAIASDRPDARVVRLLLAKGADPKIKSKDGETALDWAKKFAYGPVLESLGLDRGQGAPLEAGNSQPPSPREAVEKSLALLQRTSGGFFKEGGCISCHAQNLTGMAVAAARANGIRVDEAAAAQQLRTVKLQWASLDQLLLQRIDPPGAVDTIMYSALHLAAEGAPPDLGIDAMIHNIAGEQRMEGNWHVPGIARPPLNDGDFGRTAISLRVLAIYAPAGRKAEFVERIQRAAAWLSAASPLSTEDRNMQLLGLKWAQADRRKLEEPLKKLVALQRADGGWAQTPDLASDAYATGQTLYTLHEIGVPVSGTAYRRGVEYLLRTQLGDGSWRVKSRAPRFQPYFQSGFPHDHDQWISSSATAWSAMALTYAIPAKPMTSARR